MRYDRESISLRPASNGYILSFCCYVPGEYEDKREYMTEVFKYNEGAKALKRLNEMVKTTGIKIEEKEED